MTAGRQRLDHFDPATMPGPGSSSLAGNHNPTIPGAVDPGPLAALAEDHLRLRVTAGPRERASNRHPRRGTVSVTAAPASLDRSEPQAMVVPRSASWRGASPRSTVGTCITRHQTTSRPTLRQPVPPFGCARSVPRFVPANGRARLPGVLPGAARFRRSSWGFACSRSVRDGPPRSSNPPVARSNRAGALRRVSECFVTDRCAANTPMQKHSDGEDQSKKRRSRSRALITLS